MAAFCLLLLASPAMAQPGPRSIADTSLEWPGLRAIWQVVTLQDYNTRIVILGTACLGLAAGMIGTFMLLRKRALLGDALSHATLPGIALAFILMAVAGGSGKYLPGLLAGAAVSGLLGVGLILLIRHFTRLKEDAALGIVLSVFFGVGIAFLGIIQNMGTGSAAGLESFIYGKTASMLASDARIIAVTALLVAFLSGLLFKEFTLLCFDQGYASAQGWPVVPLDLVLMTLVTAVTVIGLQAVGLILMLALLIIPPAAARFWTDRLAGMLILSALIGAISGMLGAALSALTPRMPAGAIIVLAASSVFFLSMLLGRSRGVLWRWVERHQLNRAIDQQNLLRTLYEIIERRGAADLVGQDVPIEELTAMQAWSPGYAARRIRQARRSGLVLQLPGGRLRLTDHGAAEARRVVRNHRLWEIYLITHADVAPGQVDRDADRIEHVLGKDMVAKLERLLADEDRRQPVPASPHPIA